MIRWCCVGCRRPYSGEKVVPCTNPNCKGAWQLLAVASCRKCEHYGCKRGGFGCQKLIHPRSLMHRIVCGEGCVEEYYLSRDLPKTPISYDTEHDVDIITSHFNPASFKSRDSTYHNWLEYLGPLQSKLTTVELAFDDDDPISDDIVVRKRREASVMWQKERLINYAASQTRGDYIAWIDHDLVFENPNWINDAIAILERGYDVVQLFASVVYVNADGSFNRSKPSVTKSANGAPGGAWITTRKVFERVGGLPDSDVVGGADQTFASGVLKSLRIDFLRSYPDALLRRNTEWIEAVGGLKTTFLNTRVTHLWHGQDKNRQHTTRCNLLKDFDPARDLRIEDGVYVWTDQAPENLKQSVLKYFQDRAEDSTS